VWTETAKDEERTCKEKSVRELKVSVGVSFSFLYCDYNNNNN